MDVAAENAVPPAAADDHAVAAEPADGAAGEQVFLSAFDHDAVGATEFERQAAERHVFHPAEDRERLGEDRNLNDRAGERFGRKQVDLSAAPIQVPFARLVELLQDVEKVVGLALAVTVGRAAGRRHLPSSRVDLRDLDAASRPEVDPVAEHPDIFGRLPLERAIFGELERAGPVRLLGAVAAGVDRAGGEKSVVRPPRQFHRPAVHVEVDPGIDRVARQTVAAGQDAAEIDPKRLQIALENLPASRFGKPAGDRRISDRPKLFETQSTRKHGPLARIGLVENRRLGRPAIGLGQYEGASQRIGAAADHHGGPARRQAALPLSLRDGRSGARQGGKRLRLGPLAGVVAIGRHVEHHARLRWGR